MDYWPIASVIPLFHKLSDAIILFSQAKHQHIIFFGEYRINKHTKRSSFIIFVI